MADYPGRGRVITVLLFLMVGVAHSAEAQTTRFDVRGVVVDSAGVGLSGATVVALTRMDSVLTKFATTGGSGAFRLLRVPVGDYILQVTFVGFQAYRENITIVDSDVETGTITLGESISELDELVVSADHIPFVATRDTLDYNARAFPTRPNAVVEDLLRRLPGIDIEEDGSITAQGEDVQNVLVEGKEFFGSDPTIATKNLPADAVERVQVYDKQSDRAEFTGISDGQEEKTINLVLKEGAKHGYFGRVSGGFGGETDIQNRYDGEASINRFSPITQLAVIANTNNVNRPGFAWGDFLNFMGGSKGFADSGGRGSGVQIGGDLNDGFSETLALGLNASHDFTTKTWIRSSYFLSSLDNLQDRIVRQQQLFGSDVNSFVSQNSHQTSDHLTHQFNLNAQATFSDGHDLRLRGNFYSSASSLGTAGFQETMDGSQVVQNTADTRYDTEGDNLGGNALLTWRKRLNENGRSIIAQASVNLSDSHQSSDLSSTLGTADRFDVLTYEDILQEQARFGRTLHHTERLSLTEPLGTVGVLELFGERTAIMEDQTQNIFDLTDLTTVFNDSLSSGFERTYTYLRGGLQFSRNTESIWFTTGLNIQRSNLDGTVLDRDESITHPFTHVLPSAYLKMVLGDAKSLDVRYNTSTREPTITELQPFVDNSDPLNVYVGNPELTPEYRHSLNTMYRFFDLFSFLNFSAGINVTYTDNRIVPLRVVDEENLSQVISAVNSDGGWTTGSNISFGTPIRPLGARINISNRTTYQTGTELVNAAENQSKLLQNTLSLTLDNRVKEIFDLRGNVNISYNSLDYSLNDELNQNYINSSFVLNGSYYLGYTWTFAAALKYLVFDEDVFGPSQNITLLEASVSRLMMNERAEIRLAALDLLNQNQGVNFTNSSNYIQEERIESLGQYIMLRFIYRLSGLGSRTGR